MHPALGIRPEVHLLALRQEVTTPLAVDLEKLHADVVGGAFQVLCQALHHPADRVRFPGACLAQAQQRGAAPREGGLDQRSYGFRIDAPSGRVGAPGPVHGEVPMRHEQLAAAAGEAAVVAEDGALGGQDLHSIPGTRSQLEVEQRPLPDEDLEAGGGYILAKVAVRRPVPHRGEFHEACVARCGEVGDPCEQRRHLKAAEATRGLREACDERAGHQQV
mmetsp:Transcript_29935/g.78909  ORF Transcript_29935/g.78909 Transcript_29935/m.78909 type:complete len:219 (-) Transcript_29935:318-974(-)